MLLMSLTVLAALVVVILLSLSFAARAAAKRAEAAREVGEQVAAIQKKAHDADQKLAATILGGTPVDPAIAQFQKERAALLPAGRTDDPWAWAGEDLDAFRKDELRRRREEIGRRLLLPAVGSVLVVALVTAGVLAALYHHAGRHAETAPYPADGPVPLPATPPPAGAATAPAVPPDPSN